jgi:RNA polymerase sigma-70 factor (family 1)
MPEQNSKLLKLFSEIQSDDAAAFNEFFALYHVKLLGFAQLYTNQLESAEEIVSELFVKVWQNRAHLSKILHPEVYIFISVKNASLNSIRSKQRRFSTVASEDRRQVLEEVVDQHTNSIEDKELKTMLDLAVESLPNQRRIIFLMIKMQGLKPKEVADILGLSTRTVESQLYKAVKTLAELISDYLGYHPQAKKMKQAKISVIHLLFF